MPAGETGGMIAFSGEAGDTAGPGFVSGAEGDGTAAVISGAGAVDSGEDSTEATGAGEGGLPAWS